MKNSLLIGFMTLMGTLCFAQTGVFQSKHYSFRKEGDVSKSQDLYDTKTFMLNLDVLENKTFIWHVKSEKVGESDLFYKWNIESKVDVKYNQEKNLVETIYTAKSEILGTVLPDIVYLVVVNNVVDKSLTIYIYQPKYKSTMYFYNLIKV